MKNKRQTSEDGQRSQQSFNWLTAADTKTWLDERDACALVASIRTRMCRIGWVAPCRSPALVLFGPNCSGDAGDVKETKRQKTAESVEHRRVVSEKLNTGQRGQDKPIAPPSCANSAV